MMEQEIIPPANPDLRLFAASGDPQAFARLTHRHINMVYTFCRRQLSDAALAEDATQAVFILLAQKGRSMKPDTILASWLFEAARRCCANARRSVARRTRHETEAAKLRPEHSVQTISQSLEQEEIGRSLHLALQRLGWTDRTVLLLRYFNQHSNRDVGEVLGLSEEAAKTRVVRAVRKLRSIILREIDPAVAVVGPIASGNAVLHWLETNAMTQAPPSLVQTCSSMAVNSAAASSGAAAIASGALATSKAPLIAAIAVL